jgi:hypothetical protein
VIVGVGFESRYQRWLRVACVTVVILACSKPDRPSATERSAEVAEVTVLASGISARIAITGPTVIAYFLVPPGAVDTMPNLAVEADDWNVAMATLRDSLDAGRIDLAMTTMPTVQIEAATATPTVLSLGPALSAGYVFVRPGDAPCVRRGGVDQAELLATARQFFVRPPSLADTSSQRCGPPPG